MDLKINKQTLLRNKQKKTRFSLLHRDLSIELEQIANVLTHGAEKYGDRNWQHLENPLSVIEGAFFRHQNAWLSGKKIDEYTKLPNLAHAICNLLFLLYFENNKK